MSKELNFYGEILHIKYRASDGWGIFDLQNQDESADFDLEEITCTGHLLQTMDEGDQVTVTGLFVDSGKYGQQLKCSSIIPDAIDIKTDEGVSRLLQKLPGIGPAKANSAIEEYGAEQAWRVAAKSPEDIGVRESNIKDAKDLITMLTVDKETLVYLLGIGLTDYEANKIMGAYEGNAINVVAHEPYRIIDDISGFGFRKVDAMALKAGISVGNTARVLAALVFLLNDSQENGGNVWIRGWELVGVAVTMLKESATRAMIRFSLDEIPTEEAVRSCIYTLKNEGKVYIEGEKVYSKELRDAEQYIFDTLNDKDDLYWSARTGF